MRNTREFVVYSCPACERRHELTVAYTGRYTFPVGLPPPPVKVELDYECPVKKIPASYEVEFDSPVEDPEVIAVKS